MLLDSSIASVTPPQHVSGRVRVWHVDLDRYAAVDSLVGLSPSEEARAGALSQPGAGQRFRAAHHALRTLLGAALGRDGRDLGFVVGPFGRPVVVGEPALHFSLSHSEGVGLVGFSNGPIGVDVEVIRTIPESDALAEAHFTAEELTWWRSSEPGDRDRALLDCWTRKEAVAKAFGVGLSLSPCRIETLGDNAPRAWLGGAWRQVVVGALSLGPGAVAAVALADHESVAEAHRALAPRRSV